MDIKAIQEETAKALGVSVDDVSYITEALVQDYRSNAKEVDGTEGDAEGREGVRDNASVSANWGTYGNSITYDSGPGGKIYWKQNPKGSANYGCGTSEDWSAGKQWGSHVKHKGNCADGKKWFFIGNYNG